MLRMLTLGVRNDATMDCFCGNVRIMSHGTTPRNARARAEWANLGQVSSVGGIFLRGLTYTESRANVVPVEVQISFAKSVTKIVPLLTVG